MIDISIDQEAERAMSTEKRQMEYTDALPSSNNDKQTMNQREAQEDFVCSDHSIAGADQTTAVVSIDSVKIADGSPIFVALEGSEHSSMSWSGSPKMSVSDCDESTRGASPAIEDPLFPENDGHAATKHHRSPSETDDGLMISCFYESSVKSGNGSNGLKDMVPCSDETVLNDDPSASADQQGPTLLNIPTDRPRVSQYSADRAQWPIRFSKQLTQSLKSVAQAHDVDLGTVLLAAWSAVLSRLSSQHEIPIAVQGRILGRRVAAIRHSAYSSLCVDLSGDPSTVQLLELVKRVALDSEHHPIGISQVGFSYDRAEESSTVKLESALPRSVILGFELELNLKVENEQIEGAMTYATMLFDPQTIERHVGYLNMMLGGMVSDATQLVSKTDIISPTERTLLLEIWNETLPLHQEYQTIQELFEEQVKRTPEAIALVHEDQELTYSELNAWSNRLAHQLIELGVKPDALVAVCVEPSLAMVVAILAILKAGGAYVPLDPTYPSERIRSILEDASPAVMVIDEADRAVFGGTILDSLTLVDPNTSSVHPTINPQVQGLTSRHLAYIIYTSGSTGKPKGVMIEHRGVVNLAQTCGRFYGVNEGSRVLQFASISFDSSVWEIMQPLSSGGSLYLLPEGIRLDRDKTWDFMRRHSISHVAVTPSFLQDGKDLPQLIEPLTVVFGGETLSPALLQTLIEQGITVVNDYGPTETTISATSWMCPVGYKGDIAPIGRPVVHSRIYVLDAYRQLAPAGAIGELYIGGIGVARGYLNRPELTAERFLPDPFNGEKDARMYRTGDIGRRLPDGNLVHLGRADDQVKIRGFRIELGEIESCLLDLDWVSEAVVLALDTGDDKQLVAYVVAKPRYQLAHSLRAHVAAKLPQYMVPAAFVRMEVMPLTSNDKLDRKALPAPDGEAFARETYEAPRGDIENKLAAIWAELLSVDHISRNDSFFALGGHSLLAARMLRHLKGLGLTVSVRTLFEFPTLSALALELREDQEAVVPINLITTETTTLTPETLPLIELTQSDIDHIVQSVPGGVANIQDIYPLSPLQEGILFHHLLASEGDSYLITLMMAFETRELLDRYLDAFQKVADRHDILRTAFFWEGLSTSAQVVLRSAPLPVLELTLDPADGPIREQLDHRFNPKHYRIELCRAPLLQFIVSKSTDGRWILVQLQHHLTGDHDAAEVMNMEIRAFMDGLGGSLQAPRPFRELIAQSHSKSSPEAHERFFKEMLKDVDEPTLPFGLAAVYSGGTDVTESHQMLPHSLNTRLRQQATKLGVSLAALCHVAWAQVLAHTSGQQRVVFGTVLFGRMQADGGLGNALGLSINTLPFRCDIDERDARDCVQETNSRLLALLEHEHASLALAQQCSSVPTGTSLFSGILNYRHTSLPSNGSSTFSSEFVSEEEQFRYPGIEFLSGQERTNYPFNLSVEDFGTALGLTAQVMQPIDPARVCAYVRQAMENLLKALENTSDVPIRQVEVLPVEERQMLLQEWSGTQDDFPDNICLHQLFEQQAERTPEAIAVVYENQSLTYAEVNARANFLAHRLIDLGVQPEVLVAICVERSPAMIIGILAILKAGGAYVPLDPSFASDRLRVIIGDTAPACLVADKVGRTALGEATLSALSILDPNVFEAPPLSNPSIPILNSRNLAYVIYTSGTTGKPKGVMIEHHGAVNFIVSWQKYLPVQASSRMTQFFSISFDASVYEIFGTLCFGGCLHLLQENIRQDRHQLWDYLEQHRITHSFLIPSILQDCGDLMPLSTQIKLMLGGEPYPVTLARKVQAIAPNSTIMNVYGPTETTVYALAWEFAGLNDVVPIGRPIANTRVYLLDAHGNPVPQGVLGEIYIGGVGVARGYLNRPELTAEKFSPDPFSSKLGARMYRTGDMARHLPDGNIVCLGRNDHQVKVRGFRIELGEIEARLSEHPLVSKAVVIALGEGNNKRLVAYVITSSDYQATQVSYETQLSLILRSHLVGQLPEYMVPAAFVRMVTFPLTPNGKLDRRALPTPGDDDFARQNYEAPEGEIEIALAAIWSDLLGIERVSRHDGFFALGGHSLLAVRLMNRVAILGTHLPLSSLFASPVLSAFAAIVKEQLVQDEAVLPAITPVSRDGMMPLSFAQQRLWFLAQLEGVSDTYHMPFAVHLKGTLDRSAWRKSMDDLYSRHEALRSVFTNLNGQPNVCILPIGAMPLRCADLRGTSDVDVELEQLCVDETRVAFDLEQGPLIRAMLIQLADNEHVLLITQHHIVSDGWSLAIIQRELSVLYSAYCNGESDVLPPLKIQYPDYAAWQRQWLSSDRLKEQRDYWRSTLLDAPILLELPTDRSRPPQQSFIGSQVQIAFDAEITSALKRLSHQNGVTLFMTILTAWAVVLSRLSGQDDIIIGTPSANRSRQEIESLIGFFVNTLALRIDLSAEPSMVDLLERVRRITLASYTHQDLPFEQVVEIVQPPRRMDHTPLFQVMFAWQNNEFGKWSLPGLQVTEHELDHNFAKFDLTLDLGESDGGIVGSLGYATSLFDKPTIEKHVGYLTAVLQQMASHAEQPIVSIDILSPDERALLLQTWNETQEDYPDNLCLHQLFEQQAERTPEAIAVVYENQSLTYAEVNTRANCLAHRLIGLGVQPGCLVSICVERSPAMIIGILGILKAGGAYVPLDPFYASDRLRDILQDTSPICLVADKVGRAALGEETLSTLLVLDPNVIEGPPLSNPSIPVLTSRSLAYVIYTSGTTGKPKGVMIEHQGVVNLTVSKQKYLQVQASSRMTQFFSFGFDPSICEIFGTLCFGGSLYLLNDRVRQDRHQLWDYLEQNRITHASFTPSTFQDCGDLTPLSWLTNLVLGGEPLTAALARKVQAIAPNSTIINEYGPTETTVAALAWEYSDIGVNDAIPIGRPLANKRVYLLDAHGNPVPQGVLGEICIGGVGVARGYLNRPELTAEKFLPDPFSSKPGARMYRTGDMARHLPDGNIVCLGRNDHQVKIRGFRIELGEIDARLSEHPLVSQAVVVALGEGSNKRLVAYVITGPDYQAAKVSYETQLSLTLRSHLVSQLPEYMVPAAFVRMVTFPLTANGKLDRRALPAPGDDDFARQNYEAPEGEIEIALAAIWSDLLGIERVSRHDGFFALGGHSLLAVRLMNRVAILGTHLPLSSLFASPVLSAFAVIVKEQLVQDEAVLPAITPVSRDGMMPLSFAQQRLWFLAQLEGVSDTYHMPFAVHLKGTLDRSAWRKSMDDLYSRHEALRSVFTNLNGQPNVCILPIGAMPLRCADLRGTSDVDVELEQLCVDETRVAFDLEQGPLIRAMLIQLADNEHVLLITQHHIVSDGWSLAIIQRELSVLYSAYCNGESDVLPPLKIQYPDYAAWQRQWLSSDRLMEQRDYWRSTLLDAPVLLELPTDRSRPPQQSFIGSQIQIALDAEITSALKRLSHQNGVTLFMTILTAWAVVLSRLSGQDDIIIGTPSANRSRQEIESLIGLFVNTLALRIDLSAEPSMVDLLERVRRSTLTAFAHQDLPFEQVVEIVQPPRRMDHTPLFQVMFAWQNNEFGKWSLPGLEVTEHELDHNFVKFDLTLDLGESDGGIVGSLGYATSLFDQPTIEKHVGYLTAVLQQMVSHSEQSIVSIDILSPDERALLLQTWNETQDDYPDDLCLHHLFEQQAERTPEAIAVVYESQSLTYAEVNAQANYLAHRLINLGVQPDVLVAICVERSPAMIIGILAILKAGGAYVPLDPFFASDRLSDIFSDAAPTILIADQAGRSALKKSALKSLAVLDPNALDPNDRCQSSTSNPTIVQLTSRNLAYVIYTSGTTGKPKGVMLEHQGAVNLVYKRPQLFEIHTHSRVLQNISLSFDHSVSEIFSTLLCGASLYLVQDDIRLDRHRLWDFLARNEITHASFTPTLLQDCNDLATLETLQVFIVMGEAMPPHLPGLLKTMAPNSVIINSYGPTESSVSTTTWKWHLDFSGHVVPIGRPLPNKIIYLLDNHSHLVPMGATGEIYIGGTGAARGYLNRPELTAEKFLPDPFSRVPGARMYRTGDMARYLPDSNIVHMGRNDHQVKIRGFRIELGEIEARLSEHPLVSETVVVALGEGSNKRLVAYIITSPNYQATQASFETQLSLTLRSHLVGQLPEYMVPAAFVSMDAFPLTPSGKLDRRALPAPGENDFARQNYEAPQGEIENALATIWAELLHLDRVSRNDSFFALGGHSLLAVRMISRLHSLGLSVSVRALFDAPELSVLAQSIGQHRGVVTPPNLITPSTTRIVPEMLPLIDLTQTEIDHIVQCVPGGVNNIQDIYALSPAQEGTLFHHLLPTSGDTYLMYSSSAYDSRESLDLYLTAMQQIVNRHDILRTAFMFQNLSSPAQVVWRDAPLSITELKLDSVDGPISDQLKNMFDPRHHRIDLTQAPLFRFAIAQDTDDRWILVELCHHLICDHTTFDIIEVEIQAFSEGRGNTLPPAYPFRNLIAQVRLGMSEDAHVHFFKDMLMEIDTPSLPFGLSDVLGDGAEVKEWHMMLPQDLNNRLRPQASRLGVSLASLCHVAWGQVIARTSGQERVVFGTVLIGRMQGSTSSSQALGLFVNTLPLRVDLDKGSVASIVRETHARLATLLEHEHASLVLAQRCSTVPAGMPLFSSALNYRHNTELRTDIHDNTGVEIIDIHERNNFPFVMAVEDYGSALGLTAQVVRQLDAARIWGYMQEALVSLVNALERDLRVPAFKLEVLPFQERQLLLQELNTTQEQYPDDLCLHHLFEQQAERTPGAIAVVYESQSLTYVEVNTRANCLAHRLIGLGVQPGCLVSICVERSPAMIIGILGILKAGGAYVPLDPFYASDRLRDILQDTSPICLVADKVGRAALGEETLSTLFVLDPNVIEGPALSNPSIPVLTSRSLAYVIYTSGTTGKPKGVMIEHQGVVNLTVSKQKYLQVQASSRMTQFFSFGFDPSICEIFGTLCFGGSLYLLNDRVRQDRHQLWDYLEQNRITHASFTPSTFQDCGDLTPLSWLTNLVLGGEPLTAALARKVQAIAPNSTIINEYGPTETTVAALAWEYSEIGVNDAIPIGRPLANKRVYLLDAHGNPVPQGVLGEICIGGVGVARGYLNRPELTAEKFLPDPFSSKPGARMYRTGDMARHLPDGNIVCLGRNDHQVKIRGFRIELGEIDARLSEHPLVSQAVVVALGEGSNKRLVAYVITSSDYQAAQVSYETQLSLTLRSHLAGQLPEYMVPAAFVRMVAFPLTPNGKLDRRALPAPGDDDFARQNYDVPQGEIENVLASIWMELLKIDKIGRNDSFFVLGGHSLMAVRMITRVRMMLGFDLTLRTVFELPTIAELAPRLLETGASQEESFDILLPIKPQGTRPPLFCIHPSTGLSWCYTGLATRLHPDQPVYGLQARGFIGDQEKASNLDEMVLDYLSQVRRVQPHGPYQLLGYSFGGLVANAMAACLEKQGERVVLVALMDTHADGHRREERKVVVGEKQPDFIQVLVGNREMYSPDLINPFLEKAPAINNNNNRIARLQPPKEFSADLLIFRATIPSPGSLVGLIGLDDWKPYAFGSIEICDIECEHIQMDLPEPMTEIARILNLRLQDSCNPEQKEE